MTGRSAHRRHGGAQTALRRAQCPALAGKQRSGRCPASCARSTRFCSAACPQALPGGRGPAPSSDSRAPDPVGPPRLVVGKEAGVTGTNGAEVWLTDGFNLQVCIFTRQDMTPFEASTRSRPHGISGRWSEALNRCSQPPPPRR